MGQLHVEYILVDFAIELAVKQNLMEVYESLDSLFVILHAVFFKVFISSRVSVSSIILFGSSFLCVDLSKRLLIFEFFFIILSGFSLYRSSKPLITLRACSISFSRFSPCRRLIKALIISWGGAVIQSNLSLRKSSKAPTTFCARSITSFKLLLREI